MVENVNFQSQLIAPLPVRRLALDKLRFVTMTHLVIALHLVFTLALAFNLNIWLDESYALHTTGQGVAFAFRRALDFELQPPLYFVLMGALRRINDSLFFARLPSVLCAALTLQVIHRLAKRYFKEINPALIVACVAFNPYLIWAASETRLYALAILLSALLMLLFFDGFLIEKPRAATRWLYVLVAALALYTQYFLGFLLLANACALVMNRYRRALPAYLVCMSAVAICFVPMVLTVLAQVADHTQGFGASPSFAQSIGIIFWRVQEYLLPVEWTPLYFWRRWLLRIGFVLLFIALAIKKHRIAGNPHVALWTTTVVTAACFVVALYFTAEALMQIRHTAALFVPITLTTFSLITASTNKRMVSVWAIIFLSFSVPALASIYAPVAKRGDWHRVASYIAAAEDAGQPILVYQAASVLPLSHYYAGSNALVPLPEEDPLVMAHDPVDALRDERQIEDKLEIIAPHARRVWLVNDWACASDEANEGCPVLEDFVEKNYIVESRKAFYYSEVRLLRRKEVQK